MYRLFILFAITVIYIVNNRKIDKKSESYIYTNKFCQFFPKSRIRNNVTFVSPNSDGPIKDKNVKNSSKNELLVNFHKYYTYDKNNKLVDKVLLSNTPNNNFSTLSICDKPGSRDCKTLNLYLVNQRDDVKHSIDNVVGFDSEKESSLVYDIDLINKNIISKEYDPYKNVFQVMINKDSKEDNDIILKLNNNNNLVYELNGVRLKNVKIHSLEVLNTKTIPYKKNRRDFVLISHNTISNKKSFLIIKLKYISLNDIDKGKVLSIRLSNDLPKDPHKKRLSLINLEKLISNKNKTGIKNNKLEFVEDDEESERVIELDEDRMLLRMCIYNDNVVYVNNVEILSNEYKFLVTSPSTYNIKFKNKTHKLIFIKSKDNEQKGYKFIEWVWVFTIINVFYSLYKFYFESLNYIIFLVMFSNHLTGRGTENVGTSVGKLIKFLLIYVDDKTGNLNVDMTKSFLLLILLNIISSVIIILYSLFLLFSTSNDTNIRKKIKNLKRYKMNALILLNYLLMMILINHAKLYKNLEFVYARGFKTCSISINLFTSMIIITLILMIYHLYPECVKGNELNGNKKFKLTDIIKEDNYYNLSNRSSNESGYKQKLITKPIIPKDKNVIIIDRKYQILYINSIITETLVIVSFYLTSKKDDKETGIFLIKFIYWFFISIYIQRNRGYYNQEKFNKYLLTKSLRYLIVTSLVILQMFIKEEFMAYLIFIYVNHCINHKVVYNMIKLAKKYRYVVAS